MTQSLTSILSEFLNLILLMQCIYSGMGCCELYLGLLFCCELFLTILLMQCLQSYCKLNVMRTVFNLFGVFFYYLQLFKESDSNGGKT